MRVLIKVIFLCLLCASLQNAYAQSNDSNVWMFAKSYKDSVAVRWQFNNSQEWLKFIKNGATLYRKDLQSGDIVAVVNGFMLPFDDSTLLHYKYSSKDSNVVYDHKIAQTTLLAMSMQRPDLYPYKSNRPFTDAEVASSNLLTDTVGYRHFIHSLTCFEAKEAGIVAALYFMDKTVQKDKKYEYYLSAGKDPVDKAFARVMISTSSPSPELSPVITYDYTNKKTATIKWRKIDTSFTYVPFYDVYRSDNKDKGYVKLNKNPELAIFKNEGKDSLYAFFSDSTLEKDKVYYYKVVGIDIFYDYTGYSKPYMVKQITRLETPPRIVSTLTTGDHKNILKWEYEETDKPQIVSFQVYRSEYFDSLYTPLSKELSPQTLEYKDEHPELDVYYKVLMKGTAGDTAWSSPSYAHIPDSIAPAAPVIISGNCDSNGVVRIKWTHGKEKDLGEYRLLKANHLDDEFSGLYTSPRLDTLAFDSLSLNTTTEYVYYKMQLLDESFNPSEYSNIIKVKRVDIIPPTPPLIHGYVTDTSGIELRWANSSSEDAVKTVLQRKMKDEMSWHSYKTFANDTSTFTVFLDSNVMKGQWYEYRLQTVDDDNLSSEFTESFTVRAYDNGIRPALKVYKAELNKKKHTVKFTWSYNERGVELFQIYRGTNDKPITILKSVDENTREYYDSEISPGAKYTYRLKVVFKDGGESPYTEEIIIQP